MLCKGNIDSTKNLNCPQNRRKKKKNFSYLIISISPKQRPERYVIKPGIPTINLKKSTIGKFGANETEEAAIRYIIQLYLNTFLLPYLKRENLKLNLNWILPYHEIFLYQ